MAAAATAVVAAAAAASATATAAAAAAATDDIRGIRGPKAVPGSWVQSAVLAVVVIAVLCGVWVLWRQLRRAARPLSASARAQRRLEGARSLMRPDTARAFGIVASEVIRDYVEERFGVVATRQTTEEFLQALLRHSNEALAQHRAMLAQFLQQCDAVKFAGVALAGSDMEALWHSARDFVAQAGDAAAA